MQKLIMLRNNINIKLTTIPEQKNAARHIDQEQAQSHNYQKEV